MKTHLILLIGLLAVGIAAWTKEDHEIFRIRDELELHEGEGTTFYSFLEVSPSASQDEISKAYRKRSRQLHPDKASASLASAKAAARLNAAKAGSDDPSSPKTKKQQPKKQQKSSASSSSSSKSKSPTARELKAAHQEASERFARLGLIAAILRGEGRARYDHFLSNGFPRWRGTGYYYARFRPGLGSTLLGLFVAAGGVAHYVALVLGHKRQREFVVKYIRNARRSAWGDSAGDGSESGGIAAIAGLDGLGEGVSAASNSPADGADGGDDEAAAARPAGPTNRRERRIQERETRKETSKSGRAASKHGRGGTGASGTSTPLTEATAATPGSASRDSSTGPTGPRRRIAAENGKTLVVEKRGNVFLEEEDEETGETRLLLLDPAELQPPTFRDTALWKLPAWGVRSLKGLVVGGRKTASKAGASGAAGPEIVVGDGQDSGDDDEAAAASSSRAGRKANKKTAATGKLAKAAAASVRPTGTLTPSTSSGDDDMVVVNASDAEMSGLLPPQGSTSAAAAAASSAATTAAGGAQKRKKGKKGGK